jgi:hypothetical protein
MCAVLKAGGDRENKNTPKFFDLKIRNEKILKKNSLGTVPNGAKSINCVEKKCRRFFLLLLLLTHSVTSVVVGFIFYLILFCLHFFHSGKKARKKNSNCIIEGEFK